LTQTRVYVDTSALVKLIVPEAESRQLFAELGNWTEHVASEVVATELIRAIRRSAPEALPRANAALGKLTLVRLSRSLLDDAGRIAPAELRPLDAIHLATARASGVTTLIIYDLRMADAARLDGFVVLSPAE
jgi:uncharacterized protein